MSTASPTFAAPDFEPRTAAILESLNAGGQLKRLQTIEGPMDASIRLRGYGEVACFCSNNYLGLASDPRVVAARITACHPNVTAWAKEDVPARLRYSDNARIGPVVVAADVGWLMCGECLRLFFSLHVYFRIGKSTDVVLFVSYRARNVRRGRLRQRNLRRPSRRIRRGSRELGLTARHRPRVRTRVRRHRVLRHARVRQRRERDESR